MKIQKMKKGYIVNKIKNSTKVKKDAPYAFYYKLRGKLWLSIKYPEITRGNLIIYTDLSDQGFYFYRND